MGVNKCNITRFVNYELNRIKLGSRYNLSSKGILENYIQYLNCSEVDLNVCYPDNCNNPTIVFTCTINLGNIEAAITGNSVVFSFLPTDLTGDVPPLTYLWTFDNSVFLNSSGINGSTLTLTLQTGKTFTALSTKITLTITDSNNCTTTKVCYLTPTGMQCSSWVNCPNPSNLQVSNIYTRCSPPSRLIVTNV